MLLLLLLVFVIIVLFIVYCFCRAAGLPPPECLAPGVAADGLLLQEALHQTHRRPRGPRLQPRPPLRLLRCAVSPSGAQLWRHTR